jgi:uncharacterized membrane protein YhaH (DUF805 family)
MADTLGELLDPSGRLDGAAFAWRAGFYTLAMGGVLALAAVASVNGSALQLPPLRAWQEAGLFAAFALPALWICAVNCARRLRDAGGGMASLLFMVVITLAANALGVWAWALSDLTSDDAILRGAILFLDILVLAPLWGVYTVHLACMPARGARADLPPLFPEFMPRQGQGS